jgi:hypothetical protein
VLAEKFEAPDPTDVAAYDAWETEAADLVARIVDDRRTPEPSCRPWPRPTGRR